MTMAPRYTFPAGSELTLQNRPVVITGQDANGYKIVGCDDGATSIVPYSKLVELLKCPGTTIDTALPSNGGRQQQRLGGHATLHSLSDSQQETAGFDTHYAKRFGFFPQTMASRLVNQTSSRLEIFSTALKYARLSQNWRSQSSERGSMSGHRGAAIQRICG